MNYVAKSQDTWASTDAPIAVPNKKFKKPGFFKRWIYKMSEEAWYQHQQSNNEFHNIRGAKSLAIGSGSPSIDQPDRAIQFTVYNANGGRVIETRRYNTKTDRNTNGLYVITSDQNFGNEIDKIITMEALKQ